MGEAVPLLLRANSAKIARIRVHRSVSSKVYDVAQNFCAGAAPERKGHFLPKWDPQQIRRCICTSLSYCIYCGEVVLPMPEILKRLSIPKWSSYGWWLVSEVNATCLGPLFWSPAWRTAGCRMWEASWLIRMYTRRPTHFPHPVDLPFPYGGLTPWRFLPCFFSVLISFFCTLVTEVSKTTMKIYD